MLLAGVGLINQNQTNTPQEYIEKERKLNGKSQYYHFFLQFLNVYSQNYHCCVFLLMMLDSSVSPGTTFELDNALWVRVMCGFEGILDF